MPLRRIKIIRRNGTSAFSDNSNLSVSESLGTVVASLVSPLVTRPNPKKFHQNNRKQGWATRVIHNCPQPPTLVTRIQGPILPRESHDHISLALHLKARYTSFHHRQSLFNSKVSSWFCRMPV